MLRILAAAVLVLVLTGATCQKRDTAPVGDANPACYRKAVPSLDPFDTGIRWVCDAETADCWDVAIEEVVIPLTSKLRAAETSRQFCAGFINDLKRRGVIKAPVVGE